MLLGPVSRNVKIKIDRDDSPSELVLQHKRSTVNNRAPVIVMNKITAANRSKSYLNPKAKKLMKKASSSID